MKTDTQNESQDPYVRALLDALETEYGAKHPNAEINAYRQNSASLRIRIIDPVFRGLDWVERETEIWRILEKLPEDIQSEISFLLLLTPEETAQSFANQEFEHPIPSRI